MVLFAKIFAQDSSIIVPLLIMSVIGKDDGMINPFLQYLFLIVH